MQCIDYTNIIGPKCKDYKTMQKAIQRLREIAIEKNICIITAKSRPINFVGEHTV